MNDFVDLNPDIDAKRAELLPKFTNSVAILKKWRSFMRKTKLRLGP